jgi:thiol:disulfide interchange protein DsbD
MQRLLHFFLLVSVLFFSASFVYSARAAIGDEEEPDQYVFLRLLADQTKVEGGDTIRLGLEQIIHPGWHTYWLNPGDSGTPIDIDWNVPAGTVITEPEWPSPQKIDYGPLTNYGYEKLVTLLQNLTLPDTIDDLPFMVKATINLLVCHDICIPETHDVSIVLNGNTPAEPEAITAAEATLPEQTDWQAKYYTENGNFIIDVTPSGSFPFSTTENIIIAPEEWGAVDNTADASFDVNGNSLTIRQKLGARDLEEIDNLPLVIIAQDKTGETSSYRVVATPAPPVLAITSGGEGVSMTVLQAIFFALLGGMILNLMPCVFPVLSMKAMSLVQLQEKEEKKARSYGLSYAAGILISFAIIGGGMLALKAGGAQIGWGFQLQNPAVIVFLTYLVFLIGLNLSGFFNIGAKVSGYGQSLTQKSGHGGAFFTGVLATLVATPCTAPFMGAAMGFALTQSAFVSMLVFLSLGFGLALPYLILCYVPALRNKLPKPGNWMETFRQFLAFPMFVTAAWLVWVLSQQVAALSVFCVLVGLVAVSFVIWLLGHRPVKTGFKVLWVIALLVGAGFIVSSFIMPEEQHIAEKTESAEHDWQSFTPEKLAAVLKSDEPVFVNMTASWCITCKVNEKVALSGQKARDLFTTHNVQYLKGDWTNQDSDITAYLNSFNRNGVPLYVYYGPRDGGKRPEPVVLPQILTFGLIEETFQ